MDDNNEPRKASDILLALEEKVNTLVKIVSVYDMNTKLTLDRVNKIYAYIQLLQAETEGEKSSEPQSKNYETPSVQTTTDHVITVTESPIGQRRTARSESYASSEVVPAISVSPASQKQVKSNDGDRKIPVIQRVTDHTGKDLFMAEVTILDDQKDLVVKVKTNAAGKWQAYLKPGMYSVSIVKTDTGTKKKIEAMQNIEVSNSSTTITLPTATIKR